MGFSTQVRRGMRTRGTSTSSNFSRLVRVKYYLSFLETECQTICPHSCVWVPGCAGGARAHCWKWERAVLFHLQGGLMRRSLSERYVRKVCPQNQYESWLFPQLTSLVFHFQRPLCKAGFTGIGSIFNLDSFN